MDKKRIFNISTSLETETVELHWKIENFALLPVCESSVVQGPEFICTGYTWRVDMTPKLKSGSEEKVEFKLHMCDNRTNKAIENLLVSFRVWKSEKSVVCNDTTFTSISRPFNREQVLSYLSSGKSSVDCSITVAKNLKHHTKHESPKPGSVLIIECTTTLSSDLSSLVSNKEFSDVVLKVDGVEFYAHKAVLAARSPVFAAMFRHELQESRTSVISITDISAPILKELLQFIYSGNLCDIPLSDVYSLYAAADKYELLELRGKCGEFMSSNLSNDNIVTVAILATRHSDDNLKETVDDFLQKNCNQIMNSQGWKDFAKQHSDMCTEVLQRLVMRKN